MIAERPELAVEAERLSAELLASVSVDAVVSDVVAALTGIELESLGSLSGRVRGRGYVHEVDAAWELIEQAIEPFRTDVERRSSLGSSDAASELVVGIVAGLYRVSEPEMGSVLAYAGEDAPFELARGVLELAETLGVKVPTSAADDHWPGWIDLV